ncbi:MAG: hypothetical protein ABWX84_07170 [Nocardioides sp.]
MPLPLNAVSRLVAALAVLATLLGIPSTASAAPAADDYLDTVVAAWRDDPVYVSPDTGALGAEDADRLRERIDGWRDDVHIAVLPALALREVPGGGSEPDRARMHLEQLAGAYGSDGVYVVAFGGIGTYGAAIGTADDVGQIVADQVADHTLGQLDQTLDGILDDLGAPEAEGDGFPWLLLVAGAALLAVLATAIVWRRRARPVVRPSGETWAGPAEYRPSFDVQPDEHDTVAERAALAREDVTRLGEQIDREDLPATDPAVAAHVQAGLDAYYDASRRVDTLTTDDELRQIAEVTDYARWQLASARARLDGTPAPPRRAPCFVDPDHGMSVADWSWAPPGGVERPVPVCRACLARMSGATR